MSDQGDTMTLPVLDDDQVDEMVRRVVLGWVNNRQHSWWVEMRALFPAPTPPKPSAWVRDGHGTARIVVEMDTDQAVCVSANGHCGYLEPGEARAMAAALIACADWIDTHGPTDHGPVEAQEGSDDAS